METIDRASPEPYYAQLARILEGRLKAGHFKPGDRFPGETQLTRQYDLARSTVRETLRALEQQGLIRMVPNRGAFVNGMESNRWMLQVTQGFLEPEAHSPDRAIATTVLRSGYEPASDPVAKALGLVGPQQVFVLERLRQMDGKPAMHSTNWLPGEVGAALLGKPVLEGGKSLNQTLRESGFSIYSARREVAAVAAPEHTAKLLQLKRNTPILLIRSVSRDENGRPFDYYCSYVRSDVVTISVNAGRHYRWQGPLRAQAV
jgi:DNA-binding GntR family transcriptional regulator